jgi:hypothetical protein
MATNTAAPIIIFAKVASHSKDAAAQLPQVPGVWPSALKQWLNRALGAQRRGGGVSCGPGAAAGYFRDRASCAEIVLKPTIHFTEISRNAPA